MTRPVPTLESVAARAQVSRQTVSNVINAPQRVHPDTRRRVEAVIAETGYRPRSAARQLRTGRSHVVGLRLAPVTDGINGAVLDRFLHALTEYAQTRDYRIMLFTAESDEHEITRYGELLRTADLDAFVLTSTHHDDARTRWLAEHAVPFVTFGRPWSAGADHHPWVDVDGRAGTRLATAHLRELGHERIAYLGWPDGSDVGDDRRAGWQDVTGFGAAWSRAVEDGVAQGAAATDELLAAVAATAVVCASDSLALGALAALRTRGDTETAVVGFDDTPVARAVGLTSVAQPVVEAARRAVDLLLDQISPAAAPGTTSPVLLEPTLVVRDTSVPVPPPPKES